MSLQSLFTTATVAVLSAIAFLLWVFYDVYVWMWGGVR
jgi:hypothetical protein